MKKNIYVFVSVAIFTLACGVTSTLPTAVPRPIIDMKALYGITPTVPQTATGSPSTARTMLVCNSGGLNVRTGAGTAFGTVGTPLIDGTQVVIISTAPVNSVDGSAWFEVATAENGGIVGWVNSKYICLEVK